MVPAGRGLAVRYYHKKEKRKRGGGHRGLRTDILAQLASQQRCTEYDLYIQTLQCGTSTFVIEQVGSGEGGGGIADARILVGAQ